jgi:hypothetical protein
MLLTACWQPCSRPLDERTHRSRTCKLFLPHNRYRVQSRMAVRSSDPELANDPDMKAFYAFMDKYYPTGDKKEGLNVAAYVEGEIMTELLRRCGIAEAGARVNTILLEGLTARERIVLADQLETLTKLAERLLQEEQALTPESAGGKETLRPKPSSKGARLRKSG